MKTGKANRKLSSYWINPGFQGRMLLLFGGVHLLINMAYFLATVFFFNGFESVSKLLGKQGVDSGVTGFLADQKAVYTSFNLSIFILSSLVFVILAFLFTHRVAGPMYRFQKSFEKMRKDKKLSMVFLREEDFFLEVQDEFNALVREIKPDSTTPIKEVKGSPEKVG